MFIAGRAQGYRVCQVSCLSAATRSAYPASGHLADRIRWLRRDARASTRSSPQKPGRAATGSPAITADRPGSRLGRTSAAYASSMEPTNLFTARFDEVVTGGQRRVTVGVEIRDRESDGSIPSAAWFRGEEYRLDIEDEAGVAVYVRRF